MKKRMKPLLLVCLCFLLCIQPGNTTEIVPSDTLLPSQVKSPSLTTAGNIRCGVYSLCFNGLSSSIRLVFLFSDHISAGTLFEKKAYQFSGKNCREENTILEFSLLYDVLSVDGYNMRFQLHNGTFWFTEADPSYCSPLQANTVYTVGEYSCTGFPAIPAFNFSTLLASEPHTGIFSYESPQMVIVVDDEKYFYEKVSDDGCSTNMKALAVLIVACSICGLLLFALLYVVLSRVFATVKRSSPYKKTEIRTISNPLPLNVHPYSHRHSYQKCNSNE